MRVTGGCTLAPAYDPLTFRCASRLALAPVKAARIVVEISVEALPETLFDALSVLGRIKRQPPKPTAAIVRPIVRPKRADMPSISAFDGYSWSGENAHWSQSATGS